MPKVEQHGESRSAKRARMLAAKGDTDSIISAVRIKDCPGDVIVSVIKMSTSWTVHSLAWRHPNLPAWFRDESLYHPESAPWGTTVAIHYQVSLNPATPPEVLVTLNSPARFQHPNYPVEEIRMLLETMVNTVGPRRMQMRSQLMYASRRRNLPLDVEMLFSSQTNLEIRRMYSKNRYVSSEAVSGWLEVERSSMVLRDLLKTKAAASDADLRKRILSRLQVVGRKGSVPNKVAVARYSPDSEVVNEVLRESGSQRILEAAVRNDVVEAEVVEAACWHPADNVRRAARRNSKCTDAGLVASALFD